MEQEQINITQMKQELIALKQEVAMIKSVIENSIDMDTILTLEEEKRVDEALEEYERGETITLEDIEKERENAGLES